jgi:redox-sensitive bicupin YhaK (pirin superfamily)
MAQSVLHKAGTRGGANHGWLKSYHTFSFASYYNPERIQFGALRVLNDDQIDGSTGFGEHPHDNMEIISIALEGALQHEDSMGNVAVISPGEIQVMSAGTGVYHKEFNHEANKQAKFLQIWVFPNKRNVAPRYDQQSYDVEITRMNWFRSYLQMKVTQAHGYTRMPGSI